jgi:NitT/TauT family transport system permease protein
LLFNVIAGASNLPQELHLVAQNYGVKGWLWWRKLILPGIFPYYVTGAITAAGGCWNASIVAEIVTWGGQTLYATGLGGYIAKYTTIGDFPRIGLGIAVMSLYVIVINRLVWHKLYHIAENRYQMR